ncbi:single-stranded nucleic acid binding R3H [Globomyces pollinis-pini]|nr:single-stranded nucleic acid binding R3H [Globomyces pollinis-pini]
MSSELLDPILVTALTNGNGVDRIYLLKIEQDLITFIRNKSPQSQKLEYEGLNSYQRLLIHRLAAAFALDHVVDSSRKAIILYKTPTSSLIEFKLSDIQIPNSQLEDQRSIKSSVVRIQSKPKQNNTGRQTPLEPTVAPAPSIKEREIMYQKARARIFDENENQQTSSEETGQRRSKFEERQYTPRPPPSQYPTQQYSTSQYPPQPYAQQQYPPQQYFVPNRSTPEDSYQNFYPNMGQQYYRPSYNMPYPDGYSETPPMNQYQPHPDDFPPMNHMPKKNNKK